MRPSGGMVGQKRRGSIMNWWWHGGTKEARINQELGRTSSTRGGSNDELVDCSADGTSRWRGTSSSGNGSRSSQGRSNPPPIRYREGQFDYYPAVLCDCRRKAARWISWSEDNPSRRYLTCARARDGGCTFWSWYEPETTPYLRQVLNDLHNVVRGLKEEKSILRASLVSARAQIDELTAVHNGDVADWTRKLKEKDDLACELRARVVQLEEGRKLLLLIVAGLASLIIMQNPESIVY
uniref:GRF-type domain-containing protein n=1 Tax=Oryza rufipogon TaxID=4529 RepID=A0A0E0PD40_ORYRU